MAGILTDGDSITQGGSAYPNYPAQAQTAMYAYDAWLNTATPGLTSAGIVSRLGTTVYPQLATWSAYVPSIPVVYTLMIGVNDGFAAGVFANIQAACAGVKAHGATAVVVFTDLPAVGRDEGLRQSLNTAIRNGASGSCTYTVADVGNDATIGQAGQYSNTTYYLDGTHLTVAGGAIVATYLEAALTSLGPR